MQYSSNVSYKSLIKMTETITNNIEFLPIYTNQKHDQKWAEGSTYAFHTLY